MGDVWSAEPQRLSRSKSRAFWPRRMCVIGLKCSVMPAILKIPEVRERISRLSVEEYHRLDEFNEDGRRTELIRGIVIEKMSKSPLHSTIVSLLYRLLLARAPQGCTVRQEQPLTFADSEPEPDGSVPCGGGKD